MSDRRKKPMSRDQRLPRRESNLTEKSIYREKISSRYRGILDHAMCPRPTLDGQVCFVGGYQGDDFERRRSTPLFRVYSTPIDDLPRWLGKNSSFSFAIFPSPSRFFARIDPADVTIGRLIGWNTVGNCVILCLFASLAHANCRRSRWVRITCVDISRGKVSTCRGFSCLVSAKWAFEYSWVASVMVIGMGNVLWLVQVCRF